MSVPILRLNETDCLPMHSYRNQVVLNRRERLTLYRIVPEDGRPDLKPEETLRLQLEAVL